MKKICIVTTLSSSITNWIMPFLNEYQKNNIEVTIVCNMTEEYSKDLKEKYPGVKTHIIKFPRGTKLLQSIKSIKKLTKFFHNNKFDLVQYSTPNASLYAAIASKRAKIPVRVYCQWGMVFVSRKGIKRLIFKTIEKVICKKSTMIQPDSFGNLNYCRENKIYPEWKSMVIWNGSAKGLDFTKFDITKKELYAKEIKEKYFINENDFILGFVGRLGREKGCNELFKAFQSLKLIHNNLKLLFVGPIEKEETIESDLLKFMYDCEDVIVTNRVSNVEKYMAAMDIFILPSYREGFGSSVIEAQAMGVPVIVTDIAGPTDGMIKDKTGIVIPVKDIASIVDAVNLLINDSEKRLQFGRNGYEFVKSHFDYEIFKKKLIDNRLELLGDNDESINYRRK